MANLSGMRACLAMKFTSIHREVMVSFRIAKRIYGDDRKPAGIPNNVSQKFSQNPRAACRLGSDKADAIGSNFSSRRKGKSYSELITGAPPASLTMSAKSSAKTRAPLAVSGATKLMRSVLALNVSFVRVDVILRHTWMDCAPLCVNISIARFRLCFG